MADPERGPGSRDRGSNGKAQMKHVFTEPYVPGRTVKDRARHPTLPGVFPTRKASTP